MSGRELKRWRKVELMRTPAVPSLLIPILLAMLPLMARQTPDPLPKEMQQALQERVERGQEIYEYERLAWVATDMLLASKPDSSRTNMWLEVPEGNRRYIFFGKFTKPENSGDPAERFSAAYAYWAPIGNPSDIHWMDGSHDLPAVLSQIDASLQPLAHAADLIRHQPSPWHLPWNYDVFREKDGTITGYLMPGNSDNNVIPIGGDFRITLDATGTKILKTVTLHKSYLPMSTAPPPGAAKTAAMWHSHTLDEDLPPETDLGILQLYPGGLPHYLMTRYGLFCFTEKHQLLFIESAADLEKETSKK